MRIFSISALLLATFASIHAEIRPLEERMADAANIQSELNTYNADMVLRYMTSSAKGEFKAEDYNLLTLPGYVDSEGLNIEQAEQVIAIFPQMFNYYVGLFEAFDALTVDFVAENVILFKERNKLVEQQSLMQEVLAELPGNTINPEMARFQLAIQLEQYLRDMSIYMSKLFYEYQIPGFLVLMEKMKAAESGGNLAIPDVIITQEDGQAVNR